VGVAAVGGFESLPKNRGSRQCRRVLLLLLLLRVRRR